MKANNMMGTLGSRKKLDRQQRILVVDDDRVLRLHACLALRADGFEAFEVASGEDAIAFLRFEPVDAVLLDLRMPGMDGFETCREIRKLADGEHLPVIVVTGSGDMKAVRAAYEAGATDFVVKPIDWPILKQRIHYTTGARAMAENLAMSKLSAKAPMKSVPEAVLSIDEDGRVVEARVPEGIETGNRFLSVGRSLADILPPAAAALAKAAVAAVLEGASQTSFEFEFGTGADSRNYEVYLAPGGRGAMVAQVRDCTERRQAETEIRQLAYFDRVTGLPNREMLLKLLDDKLSDERFAGDQIALIRLDLLSLDYTRSLLGSDSTNALLCLCRDRLRGLVDTHESSEPRTGELLGRVGDTGFAVVRHNDCREDALSSFAERLQREIASTYTVDDYEIDISARLGVATMEIQEKVEATLLFEQAEMAMTQPHSGRIFYSSATSDQRHERARLVKDLKSAVSNGDLHLEYQPKVDAASRKLLGVEALARWDHPSIGAISPMRFIPLAEKTGMIIPIGEFVLEEACRQSREWQCAGLVGVPVAVNFSGHQFNKRGLVDSVAATLGRYGIGEGGIEIELTETVAMEHCNGFGLALKELHDIGIRTAIDDFGTGYSSLNNLRRFQFHTLKIDRSFVADLNKNSSAQSIVCGIIKMSHALGMQVVAEGVEEEQQLDYLRGQGCDLIQGYLTGRPVRATHIKPMLVKDEVRQAETCTSTFGAEG